MIPLNELLKVDRERIMKAFNELESFTIDLKDGYFISVHHLPEQEHEIIEATKYWTFGRYKCITK